MSIFDKVKSIFKDKDEAKPGSPLRGPGGGPKIWTMPPEMQREFEKGVKYNMKVVIRGMRKTGKSSLLARLHGHAFPEKYVPSSEISAATIRYQGIDVPEDHGTKVEMWDVVDVGIAPPGTPATLLAPLADSTTIDVYRSCQCVIFMVDPMRKETLDYVMMESRKVPPTAAILVALNFMDLPKPHAVTERDVDELCRRLQRSSTPMIFLASHGQPPERSLSASATWVSVSARTGYGMSVLRSFFEIPVAFVHLTALETQMKAVYQKIETHQAWMLSERARINYEEKEKARSSDDQLDASRSPESSPVASSGTYPSSPSHSAKVAPAAPLPPAAPPKDAASGDTVLVVIPPKVVSTAPTPKPKSAPAPSSAVTARSAVEDKNGIATDFFGDISEDDDEGGADKDRSSSDSSDGDAEVSPQRRTTSLAAIQQRAPPPKRTSPLHPNDAVSSRTTASPLGNTTGSAAVPPPPGQGFVPSAPPVLSQPPSFAPKSTAITQQQRMAAAVLTADDCVVDESAKNVSDDFFGSDSEDPEENHPQPQRDAEHRHVPIARRASSDTSDSDGGGRRGVPQPPARQREDDRDRFDEQAAARQPRAPPAGAATVEKGFFSDDDDPDDSDAGGRKHNTQGAAPAKSASVASRKKTETDSDEEGAVAAPRTVSRAPTGRTSAAAVTVAHGRRQPAAPQPKIASATAAAAVAPAVSVDISAMLAQMQSALLAAAPQESDDAAPVDDSHGAAPRAESRREKTEKKPKEKKERGSSDKAERKEKKDKKHSSRKSDKKKSTASDDSDDNGDVA